MAKSTRRSARIAAKNRKKTSYNDLPQELRELIVLQAFGDVRDWSRLPRNLRIGRYMLGHRLKDWIQERRKDFSRSVLAFRHIGDDGDARDAKLVYALKKMDNNLERELDVQDAKIWEHADEERSRSGKRPGINGLSPEEGWTRQLMHELRQVIERLLPMLEG